MKKLVALLALIAAVTVLPSCGGGNKQPETATSPSPGATTSPAAETSPSPGGTVKLIPLAIFKAIDLNKKGEVTASEFVFYFTVKAKEPEKLSKEDAEKEFKALDKDGNGKLTKEEATGAK